MSDWGPTIEAVIRAAVQPSGAERAATTSAVLARLSEEPRTPVHSSELAKAAHAALGTHPEPGTLVVANDPTTGQMIPPEPHAGTLASLRVTRAVHDAIVSLWQDGIIVASQGDAYGPLQGYVQARTSSMGGGIPYEDHSLRFPLDLDTRWLLRADSDTYPIEVMTAEAYISGLGDVLGPRAVRCLTEAFTAHRRRLFLASASLIAAASEAAWYQLGEMLAGQDHSIAQAIERNSSWQVIEKTAARMRAILTGHRPRISEAEARGHMMRDIRNYGLHPRTAADEDREVPFTESGSAVLIMDSRRYFSHLSELHSALKAKLES